VRANRHGESGPPWFVPALVRDATGLGLSTLAVGAVLYALAPGARPPLSHAVATGVALLVWCYCDGMVGRLCWGLAAIEALLRLRLALAWIGFLHGALGPHTG
jgi:hypothetical protein